MNKEKIKEFLKSKIGVGIVCFLVGAIATSGSISSKNKEIADKQSQITTLQSQLKDSKSNLDDVTTKLKASEDKVAQAKPYFDMNDEEQKQAQAKVQQEKADREAQEKAKAEADAKARLEAKTKTLSNGNYVAGKDFDAGTYTITAISGGGNVSSNNMYDGGINAIMGTQGGMYQKEYKNIKLPNGVTLTISDVTVKLTPVE